MSTLVAENRHNKLVPCEHMGTEQTAVVVLAELAIQMFRRG